MPVVTRAFVGGHSVYRTHYPCQPLGYGSRDTASTASFEQGNKRAHIQKKEDLISSPVLVGATNTTAPQEVRS